MSEKQMEQVELNFALNKVKNAMQNYPTDDEIKMFGFLVIEHVIHGLLNRVEDEEDKYALGDEINVFVGETVENSGGPQS